VDNLSSTESGLRRKRLKIIENHVKQSRKSLANHFYLGILSAPLGLLTALVFYGQV